MVDMKHVQVSQDKIAIYPLKNYAMVEREPQPEEDTSVPTRVARLTSQYAETGIRRSVDAIMVVSHHGAPHVLVLQVANAFYKLPGGYLDPTESDAEGLLSRLQEQLGVPVAQEGKVNIVDPARPYLVDQVNGDWAVKECLSVWWRPNFDTFLYPYLPAHITEPKEVKKLYMVELPPSKVFAIPQNMKMHAIPIQEFYDNAARYGPQFAGLPYLLSKYWIPVHAKAYHTSTVHSAYGLNYKDPSPKDNGAAYAVNVGA